MSSIPRPAANRCAQPAAGRLAWLVDWRRWAILGMLTLAVALPAHASKLTERAKQKRVAESERSDLQKKLGALKQDIRKTETAREQASDALAQSERVISEANRAVHELELEQRQTKDRLAQLTKEKNALTETVGLQQKQLAKLVREQHVAGNEDRIKLLLSGDNPNRISRELQYLRYVSQAQAKLIESLRANLAQVETNQVATQNAKDELDEIAQEAREQKAVLEQEKATRATLLAQLSNRLSAQRKEAGTIERNEQRLGSLVNQLALLIEQQRKAEAAAALRRQQAAAKAREAQRRAQQQAKNAAAGRIKPAARRPNPDAIEDDAPPKSLGRNELTPQASVQAGVNAPAFGSLRGQLRLPVRGDLTAKFGSKREGGPQWKGLFIRTAEGAEVKAVAGGQVAFADWLRGFGNLIIVDHGGQYMTIYGNNQAILKRTGDFVKMGDVIANAGNSGGNAQSGLYFEMRHQGRAFDPLQWMVR